MRKTILFVSVVALLAGLGACGDDGGQGTPDAAVPKDAPPDQAIDAMVDAMIDAPQVVPTSLTLDMANVTLADGLTKQFVATLHFSDSSTQIVTTTAAWTSTNTAAATVSNTGLATAVDPGTTMISATAMGRTGTATLVVTGATATALTVGPDNQMLCAGQTLTLTARATLTDGTMPVVTATSWMAAPTSVATVSSTGVVTAVAQGTATITASYTDPVGGGMTTDTATVIVNPACLTSIDITGAATVTAGLTTPLTATGTFSDNSMMNITEMVVWSSAPTSVATVSTTAGSRGTVTGVAMGTATITATSGAISDTFMITVGAPQITSIVIAPDNATILNTQTQQLMVTATRTDGSMPDVTATATYSASPAGIVTISAGGLVTPVAGQTGTVTITAMAGGATDTTMLTVNAPAAPAIAISGPGGALTAGGTDAAGNQTINMPTTRTYTITNTGTAALAISGVTFPTMAAPSNCNQTVATAPAASVAPGGMTTFAIETTIPATGAANCPWQVNSNAANASTFRIDVTATGTPAAPTTTRNAIAGCGSLGAGGFTLGGVYGSLSETTGQTGPTTMMIGSCYVNIGEATGGTTVNNGADMVTCMGGSTQSCTEANNICSNQGLGNGPLTAGAPATLTITDVLIGTASHTFPVSPGTVNTTAIPATQSRSAAMTFTISGGPAGTLVYTTISQGTGASQVVASCETAANATSVSIPPAVLGLFQNGTFTVTMSHQITANATQGGYNITFLLTGPITGPGATIGGQTGTFTN
ncbi:MAG: Ig-like domain-containing protein [Myxococcales bacterium]|nr:Ig-like domain-containing protein [Myxococcales bacterium]